MRTIPNISANLQPLENAIRQEFIPAILNGYLCNDLERRLFSLPAKYGGLAIFNPTERCIIEYENSRKVTAGIVQLVCDQSIIYNANNDKQQTNITNQLKIEKSKRNQKILENIKNEITDPISLRTLEAILETGVSSWLTALPIKENGFFLEKQAFWDILYLRYNIQLKNLPSKCVCGKSFTIDHALSCPRGGFIAIRHNEIRNFTAEILSECYHDVHVEPMLTPLTGENFPLSTITTDEARVDVAARGVWTKGQMAFFDVRVFNPTAKSYLNSDLSSAHKTNEQAKKRSYNRRVLSVDQGSFTPLVFSCYGGMSKECKTFYNRIAGRISEKRNINFSVAVNWLRTRINFHLIRSCLLCLRGSRSPFAKLDPINDVDLNLVTTESKLHVTID